jgi:hypothetical protein
VAAVRRAATEVPLQRDQDATVSDDQGVAPRNGRLGKPLHRPQAPTGEVGAGLTAGHRPQPPFPAGSQLRRPASLDLVAGEPVPLAEVLFPQVGLDGDRPAKTQLGADDLRRPPGACQVRASDERRGEAGRRQCPAGVAGLLLASIGQRRVGPALPAAFGVPNRLCVTEGEEEGHGVILAEAWQDPLRPGPKDRSVGPRPPGVGSGTTALVATKIDYKLSLECYKARRDTPQLITVPELQYVMIDGHGDPNTQAFAEAVSLLYPVAYKVKFASKKTLDRDYVVMPLEALWWAEDMSSFTDDRDKSRWDWTLMTMVPSWVTANMFAVAVEQAAEKDGSSRFDDMRMETLCEGLCVQALHIGPYDAEAELLRQMHHEFVPSQGLKMIGKHHEIYLSDARKVAPTRLRTILRQPVASE